MNAACVFWVEGGRVKFRAFARPSELPEPRPGYVTISINPERRAERFAEERRKAGHVAEVYREGTEPCR